MALRHDKTWSQQQLAIRLHMDAERGRGWLTWERRRLLIHAAKTALAAALCWWVAVRFGLHDGYWGSISAIIVLQSNFGATITASRDRILGTLIGAAFGFTFSLFGGLPWNYLAAVFLAVVLCGVLGFRSSSRLAGVTITIVMLVTATNHKEIAVDRVLQVLLGIVVAVAISTLVFPDRARVALRDGLAQEFLVLGALFDGIVDRLRGQGAPDLAGLRQDALAKLRANNQLLDAARNEPSGGPGWREGLSLLAQFGRALYDTLVALELAVELRTDGGYVEELEPALGPLVDDVRAGFHYVARCIHLWRFNVPPPNIHLEDDIASLDERMAALRPRGIEFPQEEILRAYAVQLHLKQIARTLRAARVETGREIGEGAGEATS
jgi:uncharacterized membrane protein YccC